MNSNDGGLSFEERQRQTAAEIARRKVMAAYQNASAIRGNGTVPGVSRFGSSERGQVSRPSAVQPVTPMTEQKINQPNAAPAQAGSTYKQMPVQPQPTSDDFKKYHSAWQGYYQKYYSDYYAKAAKQYLEAEQLKREREAADAGRNKTSATEVMANLAAEEDTSFRAKIRKIADEEEQHKRKMRKWTPIIAGLTVMVILMFLQYNRLIFAPIMAYVSPGNASETSITEVDPTVAVAVKEGTVLLIPKLNIDVPITLGLDANDTDTLNKAMNQGVVQFSIPGASALPGQVGNFVVSGHSAGDIYSNNQYKFIFSGLERLNEGDLIYVDHEGVRYTYSVTKKDTVSPTDVQALVYTGTKPILTLITCWPLGTSRYRLLVTAEQINPNPDGAEAATEKPVQPTAETVVLPENEPTFFERIWNWLTGK